MTLTITHYGILTLWTLGVILWSSRNFSWNSRGKKKSYLAYSFVAISFLAVAMLILDLAKDDYLNLVLYAVLAHGIVLFMYYALFPSRHHDKKKGIYGAVGLSLFLCSTAGVVLAVEIAKALPLWL